MSNCIITININNKNLKVNLENSSPSVLFDEDFVNALKEKPEIVKELVENLRELSINTGKSAVTLTDLLEEGIQANCTLQYLRENPKYSEIAFPDGNANILLVKNLVLGGQHISGRIITSNGEEVFVTNGRTDDIKKLTSFLKVRNKIRDQGVNLSEDSPHYPVLTEILELKNKKLKNKLGSIEDLLLDYIYNKKDYTALSVKDGRNVSTVLGPFLSNIMNWETPIIFEDPFITEINYSIYSFGYNEKTKTNTSFIHYDTFYKILKQYHKPLLDAFGITSLSKFKELGNNENFRETFLEFDNNAEELIKESKTLFEAIINYTFASEPEFDFNFLETSQKGIYLKQAYTPISSKYGIAYNTIQEMHRTSYRGYFIYEWTQKNNHKKVFVSRGTLTDDSKVTSYNSVQEAQQQVDKMLDRQQLRKNSLIEFKYRNSIVDESGKTKWDTSLPNETVKSEIYLPEGTVIESIKIPINEKTNIRGEEQALFNLSGSKKFQELINSWAIKQNIKDYIIKEMNTPEKIVTFIYKINEILGTENRSNNSQIKNIAEQIATAEKDYYYIENRYKTLDKKYSYRIIPTTLDKMSEPDAPKNLPTITWMGAISQALNNQFGIQVNLLTSSEIAEKMKNVADPNLDKAFIYNGEVYVNTSIASSEDLLHEHVHLILGILKSNPELRDNYERLLNKVVNTDQGKSQFNTLKERYSQLSQMDIKEEVFAKLFSNYIRRQVSIQTKQVFQASEEDIKNLTETIFNTNISNFEDFYGKTTKSIFTKFNKEVAKMLSENNIDFSSTVESRQISNWISTKINTGEIIENC